jgi:hypothetical protein
VISGKRRVFWLTPLPVLVMFVHRFMTADEPFG